MKKYILLSFAFMLLLNLSAQQHLSFKGVPINGTLKEYTDAMKAKGFTYIVTQDGISMLQGDFAAYKNCTIAVSTLKNLDVVSMIAVLFPEKNTWSTLLSDYNNLKNLLTEKYGRSTEEVEQFQTYAESDALKMLALHSDEYTWYTIFSTDLGDIELTLMSTGISKASVLLRYRDKVNSDKVHQRVIDDL